MKPFLLQLQEYRQQHLQKMNRVAHYISVPAILLSVLILLSWVSIVIGLRWHITFAWLGVLGLGVYYIFLNAKAGSLMFLILIFIGLIANIIGYPAPNRFNLSLFLILFIGGAVLQFLGHSFERKQNVISNFSILLTAPLFILTEILIVLKLGTFFNLEPSVPPKSKNKQTRLPPNV